MRPARLFARRWHATQAAASSKVVDIATPSDLKRGGVVQRGNVSLAEKEVQWKPLALPKDADLQVDAASLFCASDNPLDHAEDDAGRFFQLGRSGGAFSDIFYHTGFCGEEKQLARLRTAASMVRREGMQLRDELLGLDAAGHLGDADGLVLHGPRGCGKSSLLNYAIACCHQAGWLVVVVPSALDWTMGLDAGNAQAPNEAYPVADPEYFKEAPPELEGSALYEAPDATSHFLLSTYLSQREKLAQIPIKCDARRAHYGGGAPTLADLLARVCHDEDDAFNDFPVPLRPVHDFLRELQAVDEMPVLLVVDGWNHFHGMASSKAWRSHLTLHAQQLLVPSMLAGLREYGGGMARGLMLCGLTQSGATPPATPRKQRRSLPPPPDWSRPRSLEPEVRDALRDVGAYSALELQRCLEFYAHTGHLRNPRLGAQLRSGELRRKVALMTAGRGEDVFKLCAAM